MSSTANNEYERLTRMGHEMWSASWFPATTSEEAMSAAGAALATAARARVKTAKTFMMLKGMVVREKA